MTFEHNDIVSLRAQPRATGKVVGSTQGGRVMVQWATTASGERLTHGLLLVEEPAELEVIDRLDMGTG